MKEIDFDSARVLEWYEAQTGSTSPGIGIGLRDGAEFLAAVVFDNYLQASICMHVAAVPGARWMTREYLGACFRYPFHQLGVKKILGLVGSGNLAARRFDEHLGFVLEATLSDAHPDGSLLVYSMTPAQCRWLNVKGNPHGQEQRSTTC